MRVVITGATGFVGRALCKGLYRDYEVIALSRDAKKASKSVGQVAKVLQWDARTLGGWEREVDGALAVVNLAGENIGSGRWSKSKKNRILESRLEITRVLVEAVQQAGKRPGVVVQASAVGYYGDRSDEKLVEDSAAGAGFLADVCKRWEKAGGPLEDAGVRFVRVRLGAVLGADGGLIAHVLPAFRFFLGGYPGSGTQWLSWVHIDDVVGAIRFLIEHADLRGALNLAAPNPILARDFYSAIGKVMHRPAVFRLPGFVLRLLMGEMTGELLLASQRAIPKKLLQAGYKFKYVDAEAALQNVIENCI